MDSFLQDLRHRGFHCGAVLDIGANVAAWSWMAKRTFPAARFFLIEPQSEMTDKLEAFCRDYPGSQYVLAGAGAEKGMLTLTVWDDHSGSSFRPHERDDLQAAGKQRSVPIVTIDDLIADGTIEMPNLIKLDIQGFELEALRGAATTFGQTDVYIMEVSLFSFADVPGMPVLSDVINFMLERGYVVYDFVGFSRRPLDGALGQCDMCFVKQNGFLRSSMDWQ